MTPAPLAITPFTLAQRFIGIRELPGPKHNPFVLAMLQLDAHWTQDDETPWCSAFVNFCNHLLRQPRSKSLAARSWLQVGIEMNRDDAVAGFDVVVLSRGPLPQPGPGVVRAPGHVGYFAGWDQQGDVLVLGGNQSNAVSVAPFDRRRILAIRRCYAGA